MSLPVVTETLAAITTPERKQKAICYIQVTDASATTVDPLTDSPWEQLCYVFLFVVTPYYPIKRLSPVRKDKKKLS